MKLTAILLLATALQVSARTTAQTITYTAKEVGLPKLFAAVKQQTGYVFFYDEKDLAGSKPVSVNFKETPLPQVLEKALEGQPLEYSIKGNTIFITPKAADKKNPLADNDAVAPPFLVKGKVTDEQGVPLVGVNISIKGTSRSTSTDKDGLFEIKLDRPGHVLLFTMVGMQAQEIPVSTESTITVTLKLSTTVLNEVVVNTGYQTIRQEKMTGAANTVSSTELEKRYNTNVISNLEGRVPGLVNYRGATTIRGVSTINAAQGVLYVVDGLPIEGAVSNINPYDVESVTVLKDAAATAIYGARASNGVIVITTKKARSKRTTVEVSSDITVTDKPDIDYNLLSPAQQVDLESTYYTYFYANTGGYYTNTAAAIAAANTSISNGNSISPVQYAYHQYAQGLINQTQLQSQLTALKQNNFRQQYKDHALLNDVLQQYNVAIRTGGDRFQSSLVLNFKGDNTGIIKAYSRQLNIFYKGTYQVARWLDVNYGANGIMGYSQGSNSNFATSPTNVSPYLQLQDASGNHQYYTTADYNAYNTSAATKPLYSQLVNHLDELGMDQVKARQQNMRYFANLNIKILPGLSFAPQFQYESVVTNTSALSEENSYIMRYLRSVYTTLLPASGGKLATTNSTGDYWTARGQADYRQQFGKHAIDAIAGMEFRQTLTKGTSGLLLGYDDQLQTQSTTGVSFPALQAFTNTTAFKAGFSTANLFTNYFSNAIGVIPEAKHRFNSSYANAVYTYDGKYNLFGSYRVDYADVFGLDKKFRGKPLWSAALGWNIHKEAFMVNINWVNFLKLRVSYGVTGNMSQNVSSFLTANSTLPPNALTNLPVSVIMNPANPQLRWEKTTTNNLGLDFSLFNNRLSGSFDWYRKKSTDLLVVQRLDASEGFTSQTINNGGLLNDGLELGLQYSWIKPGRKDGLGWSTLLVVSKNSNKITYLDEVAVTPVALVQGGYKIGYPVNALYSFQYKGMTANGQPQWVKGDGTLTTVALTSTDLNAIVYSGGRDPKINMALTNEIYYRGFSLNVLAVYYGGQYLRFNAPTIYSGIPYASVASYLADSWTPGKTNTLIPGAGQYAPGNYPGTSPVPAQHLTYSDAFVQPGDFIKIRSIVAGYQLPARWASKLGSNNIRLRFQLNNPRAVWTKNKVNMDPETGGAPIPTSYVFGLNYNL